MRELALHVLDILQNTVEAGATRATLTIHEDVPADWLTITVADNGRGMDAATVARVTNPFYTTRTTRHVGLGLPLYAMAAEQAGGRLHIASEPGIGTTVRARVPTQPPGPAAAGRHGGDIAGVSVVRTDAGVALRAPPSPGFCPGDDLTFEFDTADIRAELGDMPFSHPAVVQWLAEFLEEGEDVLRDE